MEVNAENYQKILFAKHNKLVSAYKRVENLIKLYEVDLGCCWEDAHNWDFNLLYDLRDRIEDRIHANHLIIGDWNFQVLGFNVIDVGN